MLGFVFAGVVALGAAAPAPDLPGRLDAAAKRYYAALTAVAPITGSDTAFDYYARLLEDRSLFPLDAAPPGYTAAQYQQFVETLSTLDIDVTAQLENRTYEPMANEPGLHERFVKSTKDGTMQPVAVYVPRSYDPRKAAALVVYLHGNPQTETELMSVPWVAEMAESTGSIVVAPYGRAYYDFRNAAAQDVYDTQAEALKTFNIDPRRKYLAGYSMGGFSVFEIQAIHPNAWASVMCISGGLLGEDARRSAASLRQSPLYVLTGDKDESIDPQYTTASAAFLARSGNDVSYYMQHGGTHHIMSLLPILRAAWSDMHAGVVHPMSVAGAPGFNFNFNPSAPAVKF